MLARLGSFIVRRRRFTLVGGLLLMIAAAVFGGGVARNLIAGGFEPAGAESVRAEEVLEESFGQVEPNVVLVVTAADGDVDSDADASGRDRDHRVRRRLRTRRSRRVVLDARRSTTAARQRTETTPS